MLCLFSPQKVSRLETTRIYNGKNMPHSDLSFRALKVVNTS
ncbi:transcriptional regulator domain protein, partial [Acinetobacter baumannii 135867]